jgi:hypothetical protein
MNTTIENFETKQLGRPADPNSERQKRIKDLEERRMNGTLKLGRPVNGESKRQQRLQELEEKRANGELKKGRPINGESKRQKELQERAAKAAAGIEAKKGRPKMDKLNVTSELLKELFD